MTIDQMIADTKRAVTQMNEVVSPGEATREFYREQGRAEERQRIATFLKTILDYPAGWDYAKELPSVIALIEKNLA